MSDVQDEINKAFALVHDALDYDIDNNSGTLGELILAAALAWTLEKHHPGEAHAAVERLRTNSLARYADLKGGGR